MRKSTQYTKQNEIWILKETKISTKFHLPIIRIILTKEEWPKWYFIDKVVTRKNLKDSIKKHYQILFSK